MGQQTHVGERANNVMSTSANSWSSWFNAAASALLILKKSSYLANSDWNKVCVYNELRKLKVWTEHNDEVA